MSIIRSHFHVPPKKVKMNLLGSNGKLLTDLEIGKIKSELKDEPNGRYSKKTLKISYGILKTDVGLYAVYNNNGSEYIIGNGNFGTTKYVQNLETGKWHVLKALIEDKEENENMETAVQQEHAILLELKKADSTIISRSSKKERVKRYIIMDLEEGERGIDTIFLPSAPHFIRVYYAIQAFKAIQDLHLNNILHGDISLRNIIFSPFSATLIDFGASKKLSDISQGAEIPLLGIMSYLEYQVFNKPSYVYTDKTEMFAAGILLHELLACESYKKDHDQTSVETPTIKLMMFKELIGLIQSLKDNNPQSRPSTTTIIQTLQSFYDHKKFKKERKQVESYLLRENRKTEDCARQMLEQKKGVMQESLSLQKLQLAKMDYYYNKYFFSWTSSETKSIIQTLFNDKNPLNSKESYDKAKEYVLRNAHRSFAKSLFIHCFQGDAEISNIYSKMNKKR